MTWLVCRPRKTQVNSTGVQNSLHKERYDQVSCRCICNKRGQYRPSSTWLCFVMLCYLYRCIVLNKCLIQAIVLLSFPVKDNEDDYSCKRMFNQLVPLLYSSCFFVFMQTGMLSLISVELHKMFRWFMSSIILHHAQYIERFSNHLSSPWATRLSADKLMKNPARSTIIGITYFEWEKLVKV